MNARIFLVEDHPIYREGLKNYIDDTEDLTVCGEAETVQEALEGIESTSPHLVILDLRLKHSSGFDLLHDLRARWPDIKVLVLSMYDEVRYADRLMHAGASGYVMKDAGPDVVMEAIRAVLDGRPYASERFKEQMLVFGIRKTPEDILTDRELQIFQLLGEEHTVNEIAEILSRSSKTIHNHLDRIREKLNYQSRQQLYQASKEWVMET